MGHMHPSQVSIVVVDGLISKTLTTPHLNCTSSGTPFSHSFLILPRCPCPILGRDVLSKFRASLMLLTPVSVSDPSLLLLLAHPQPDKLPLPASTVSPWVWGTSTPSIAQHHAPIQVKRPTHMEFPSWLSGSRI